ncbi:SpoIIE family protein phosphatase [Bacillus sp. FJAT-27251]|uniref:PP2C family protein-serine/threonine phosphatase n=1 Tax=Bacillus sp. FJAT-27251 TaxID=1684142 RepID=UPI0006A7A030|nr:SpoIIE family protein phosphatase [Bacillus sp. FJAT-27251]
MDGLLDHAPCGFITISAEGHILEINQTMLTILGCRREDLSGRPVSILLTVPAQVFYQLYFVPLLKREKRVEEMHLSLQSPSGEEIPVIINAVQREMDGKTETDCILIPIRKRSEYENELLIAKKEAEGALVAKHKAHSELGMALRNLKDQQRELVKLNRQNQKFKQETEKELELARKIQEISLTDPIDHSGIQIESYYKASRQLSGDIYGFYQIDDHRYGVILLDVMGHGISSALITMSLHSLFQRLIPGGARPEKVLNELDSHLHSLFQKEEEVRHYCTAIYLLIDIKRKQIEYINAGHPSALLQSVTTGEQQELASTNIPIGMFEGAAYIPKTISYSEGDRLLLYTDGVTDFLGCNHLSPLLKENCSTPIGRLKQIIIQSLEDNQQPSQKADDQCFILADLK